MLKDRVNLACGVGVMLLHFEIIYLLMLHNLNSYTIIVFLNVKRGNYNV